MCQSTESDTQGPYVLNCASCTGMMVETMAGKSAALHGLCHDATPFTFSEDNSAVDYFGTLLRKGSLFLHSCMVVLK